MDALQISQIGAKGNSALRMKCVATQTVHGKLDKSDDDISNDIHTKRVSIKNHKNHFQDVQNTHLNSPHNRIEHNRLVGQWLNDEKGISALQETTDSVDIMNFLLKTVESKESEDVSQEICFPQTF